VTCDSCCAFAEDPGYYRHPGSGDDHPDSQTGHQTPRWVASEAATSLVMTPFESLLWNTWSPRVRSFIDNDWHPRTPHLVVRPYEAWSTFFPPFIRNNLLDQFILPKVSRAVADWNSRHSQVPLNTGISFAPPHWLAYEEAIHAANSNTSFTDGLFRRCSR
jgi:hypothetical protein